MIFKKKILLLTLFLIITFNIFLYTNNNQRTSFRFLKWSVKETSIGKLISISFFSGFFISALINNSIPRLKKISYKNEEEFEPQKIDEDINSNNEIPPQRDIRDAQPTISVNYRVVKNTEENNFKRDQNYSNSSNNTDDWDNDDNDW